MLQKCGCVINALSFEHAVHSESILLLVHVQHIVGGLLGLIIAMLLETVLLIIRTTVPPRLPMEEVLLRKELKVPRSFEKGSEVGGLKKQQ
jgi:hypothetical protein